MDTAVSAQRGSVQVEALRIAYWEAGSGPALLLLHGIGSNGESFAAQLTGLADRFGALPGPV